jgi:hypothetical protein
LRLDSDPHTDLDPNTGELNPCGSGSIALPPCTVVFQSYDKYKAGEFKSLTDKNGGRIEKTHKKFWDNWKVELMAGELNRWTDENGGRIEKLNW